VNHYYLIEIIFQVLKSESLCSSVLSISEMATKICETTLKFCDNFSYYFFLLRSENEFFVTLLHRAGITGADVPSSKCVHRLLIKCYLFKNKYNVDIPLFLQRQLHWKWHCWVLERPYQALNPILSENYAKTKNEDRQIFAISCLCQCKLKLSQHFPTSGRFFDVICFFTMLILFWYLVQKYCSNIV